MRRGVSPPGSNDMPTRAAIARERDLCTDSPQWIKTPVAIGALADAQRV
jgi:hypothetical protein